MPDLTSMKMTRAEQRESMDAVPESADSYPWGLRLNLDKETLDKLGIDGLPGVGDKVLVAARATVVGVSQHESEGHDSRSVELQITDLGIEPDRPKRDLAKALYPGESG